MKKSTILSLLWFMLFAWMFIYLQSVWTNASSVAQIPYSRFEDLLKQDKISEVTVTDTHLRGKLKEPLADGGQTQFITSRVPPEIAADLSAHKVQFSAVTGSTWTRDLLSWIVPIVAFAAVWFFIMRKMAERSGIGGGMAAMGRSRAKIYEEKDTKITFADVAGVDEAKDELKEVVGFLKSPADFGRLGARIPKGILLVGPPGTGKTLLAKAIAGEAGVPFLSINGSEFVELFVGLGAARVRDLFDQARPKAPCIIFIDELDALGRSRAQPGIASHDEKEQTLNQLLVELDGFDSKSGIVVLAATNRPELLDPALLRAGRFDRQVLIDRPDRRGRTDILKVHVRKIQLDPAVNIDEIADLTPGFTGADLENLVNEAAVVATRRKADKVGTVDFTQAIERLVAGLERRSRILSPLEKNVIACHEMGHALVASALPDMDPVQKISIIPRGMSALGYTLQRPIGDRYLMTEGELRDKLTVLLGGRAAEILKFRRLSTGAADDLVKATQIARSMVERYGMDKILGSVAYDSDAPGFLDAKEDYLRPARRDYSEETAREIDHAVKRLIDRALDQALQILTLNMAQMESGVKLLLRRETLEHKDLGRVFRNLRLPGLVEEQAPAAPKAAARAATRPPDAGIAL
jgi:cell division protease FtsH